MDVSLDSEQIIFTILLRFLGALITLFIGLALAGELAEAIFGHSGLNGHRRLTEAGLDPIFLQDVTQALKPNGLAYLFFVPAEIRIDTTRYIESLQPLQGDLYHTTFPAQVEEFLSKSAD